MGKKSRRQKPGKESAAASGISRREAIQARHKPKASQKPSAEEELGNAPAQPPQLNPREEASA